MVDGLCVFGVFMLHLVSGIGLLLRGALLVSKKMLFLSISIDEVFCFIQRSVSPLFTLEIVLIFLNRDRFAGNSKAKKDF